MWLIIAIVAVFIYLIRDTISDLIGINPINDIKDEIINSDFTPISLQKYNGKDSSKIFIAVRGKVYDVTQGKSFYGPQGPYANFAGRDASRGLALNSFDPSCLTPVTEPLDDLLGLSKEELASLDSWEELFENKYPIVGTLRGIKT